MKKTFIFAILGLAGGLVPCYGQFVFLDNYQSSVHPLITYGLNSGGPLGAGIQDGFTVGLYFGEGAFAGSVAADPSGVAIPTSLHPLLQLGTGRGSTAAAYTSVGILGMFMTPAEFLANSQISGISTLMVVAYDGTDYASSTIRGHSTAFDIRTFFQALPFAYVGDYMSTFDVRAVPEPSTLTLVGLGGMAYLLFRRRK